MKRIASTRRALVPPAPAAAPCATAATAVSSPKFASTSAASTSTSGGAPSSSALLTPRPPLPVITDNTSSTSLILSHFSSPPPLSSLHALNARLSLDLPLPLVEQALLHPSYYTTSTTSSSTPTSNFHSDTLGSNDALATLGNSLLGVLATEALITQFPYLPTRVQKAAVTMYVGPKSLASVAGNWGVSGGRLEAELLKEAEEGRLRDLKRKDRAYGHLVGGIGGARQKANSAVEGAAGGALVRWNRTPVTPTRDAILYEDVLASVPRALVGAIYQTHGFARTRTFVHTHLLPRLLSPSLSSTDLTPLLKFTSPSTLLSSTLALHSLEAPTYRLLKESGRLSAYPTFLVGVYSGERKLGEGFGSSLKMSRFRAGEDALRRYYLRRGVGEGLPSDAWAGVEAGDRKVEIDVEAMEQSRS